MLGFKTQEFIEDVDYYNVSIMLFISLSIIFFLPNIYQIFSKYDVALKSKGYFSNGYSKFNLKWKPNHLYLIFLILIMFISLGKMSDQKEFYTSSFKKIEKIFNHIHFINFCIFFYTL